MFERPLEGRFSDRIYKQGGSTLPSLILRAKHFHPQVSCISSVRRLIHFMKSIDYVCERVCLEPCLKALNPWLAGLVGTKPWLAGLVGTKPWLAGLVGTKSLAGRFSRH